MIKSKEQNTSLEPRSRGGNIKHGQEVREEPFHRTISLAR